MSDILQVLTLPIVDQNFCKKIFSKINKVTENMICAGSLPGEDTCKVCFNVLLYDIVSSFRINYRMCFHFSLMFDVDLTLMIIIGY